MKFTILRLLTHSELGMFHEYRRQGKERAKQRAINFDWDVVDIVFPSAKDSDRIEIRCKRLEDESSVVEVASWLKRQHKNWRFEGDCPTAPYYGFVDPGVLFAMVVDAATMPATASWVVIPSDHPAHAAIVNHGESARLGQTSMVALYGNSGAYCRSVLAEHFALLFEKDQAMHAISDVPTDADGDDEAPPDPLGTFEIMASAGHTLPSAVADLVDNSISHKAGEIDITFPNPNEGGRWMCIRDDGEGMTPTALRAAMRLGHRRAYDPANLGKFGYGMKGASWSQADRLTVVSKASGHDESVLTWDKEHLAQTGRWKLLSDPVEPQYANAVNIRNSGTAVLLTQMRPTMEPVKGATISPYALELAALRDHLELVFHRFLEGTVPGRERVIIRLNDEPLRPNNPVGHPLAQIFDERRIELPIKNEDTRAVLTVRPVVTPSESELDDYLKPLSPEQRRTEKERLTLNGRANDAQGFYFYRLNRLIKWGGWEELFARDEHTKLLRVAIDFDRLADGPLKVDISKQSISLPFAVADSLKEILKTPRAAARGRYDKKPRALKASLTARGGAATSENNNGPAPGLPSAHEPAPGAAVGAKPSTSAAAAKKDRTALRLVSTGSLPWERKMGFGGEHIEITRAIPELVTLAQVIEKDADAKAALSEFLRVLELAGVPRLLTGAI